MALAQSINRKLEGPRNDGVEYQSFEPTATATDLVQMRKVACPDRTPVVKGSIGRLYRELLLYMKYRLILLYLIERMK